MALRVLQVKPVPLVPKVLLASLDLPVLRVPRVLKVLSVKLVPLVLRDLPAKLVLPVLRVLLV